MKKIVIILVVVLVAWLAWDYWEQGQTSILGRQDFRGLVSRNADRGDADAGPRRTAAGEEREEEIRAEEISRSLQRMVDQLAGSLADGPVNYQSELAAMRRTIAQDQQRGWLTPAQAELARRVVGRLQLLNSLRQQQDQSYTSTAEQPIRTLGHPAAAQNRRAAQLEQLEHNWQETINTHAPVIRREIQQLRAS